LQEKNRRPFLDRGAPMRQDVYIYRGNRVLDEKKKDDSIIIENALAGDDDTAALLTLMAYKDFSYDMFGVRDDEKILEYYRKLWKFDNNRFSYRYSHVAKMDSKPIGLMTCYPAELTKKLVSPTVARLIKIGGIRFVSHGVFDLPADYTEVDRTEHK
jgi:hypothetical protein